MTLPTSFVVNVFVDVSVVELLVTLTVIFAQSPIAPKFVTFKVEDCARLDVPSPSMINQAVNTRSSGFPQRLRPT
jgi:hypothetical protein